MNCSSVLTSNLGLGCHIPMILVSQGRLIIMTPNGKTFRNILNKRIENDIVIENAKKKALIDGELQFWIPEGARSLAIEKGFTVVEIDHCNHEAKIEFGSKIKQELEFRNRFGTRVSKEAEKCMKDFCSSFIISVEKEYIEFAIMLLSAWEFHVEKDNESLRVSF